MRGQLESAVGRHNSVVLRERASKRPANTQAVLKYVIDGSFNIGRAAIAMSQSYHRCARTANGFKGTFVQDSCPFQMKI